MQPIDFPQSNLTLVSPKGMDMMSLPVHVDKQNNITTSCWTFSKEDLERINKTGKMFLRVWSETKHPICPQTEDPFAIPNPITIDGRMADRCFIGFWDDMEILAIAIDEGEHSFQVVKHDEEVFGALEEDDFYRLDHKHIMFGDQVFQSYYIFGENMKLFGLASEHHGRFDEVAEKLMVPANLVLILERINKTEI